MASTPLSLSTAGLSWVRFSATRPRSAAIRRRGLPIRASTELRWATSSTSSALALATSWAIWSLRLASTRVTLLVSASRSRSLASRVLSVSEAGHLPQGEPQLGWRISKVSAIVVNADDSCAVSRPLSSSSDRRARRSGRRRAGALQWNGSGQCAITARRQLQILCAQYGFGFDGRLGAVTEVDTVAHREVDEHLGALEADVGDPAQPRPDTRTSLPGDARRFGEIGEWSVVPLMNGNPVVEKTATTSAMMIATPTRPTVSLLRRPAV